ncbi:ketose-bisphosphate aldolase [Verrucomicrobiota bacterium]
MEFLPAAELVRKAAEGGYAIPSFCVWNAETMETVLRVAADCRAPVMLMSGPGEFSLLSPAKMAGIARSIAGGYSVPASLHLDHADSVSLVEECLSAGYTSVMLDFSMRPFADNVAALVEVVGMAKPRSATVEGEIGSVGRIDEVTGEGSSDSFLTDPEEAAAYVRQTDVDMLAVAIGNAHGNYPTRPKLDFELLGTLRRAAGVPLVLHGGSGTPEEDLRKSISLGIAKVNVASELTRAIRETLLEQWNDGRALWAPHAIALATAGIAPIVEKWIRRTDAYGKA